MRAIIVDDELLALRDMNKLLQELDGIEVVGQYQDPRLVVDAVKQLKPDIIFLDIEMPELNGMELAEMLAQAHPHIHLVFVTAYHEYALEAFELNAMDYVLKPVQSSRLMKTIQRVRGMDWKKGKADIAQHQGMLCCFSSFTYLDANNQIQTIHWRTAKAQELFIYLLHHHGVTVRKDIILDFLWPEYELERSSTHLHTTIYQIRRIIKQKGLDVQIKYIDQGYRLDLGRVKLDKIEWETGIKQSPPVSPATIEYHSRLLKLYRGDYLAEHHYIWAESEQERLRLIWLHHAGQVARCYLDMGKFTEAIMLYQQMIAKAPYMEEAYFQLMKIHLALKNYGEVKKQYKLLTTQLKEELGIEPSKEVSDWYKKCWRLEE